MTSKPTFRDWALAGIGIVFVLMGLVILPSDLNTGITTIAFFGACAWVSVGNLVRKLRYGRLRVRNVTVTGGVPIRPSRSKGIAFGGVLLGLGLVLIIFDPGHPFLMRVIAWLIAVTGGCVLAAVATGFFPGQYMQFDPAGLTLGYRGWSVLIPWDGISRAATGEVSGNPALFLWLESPEAFEVKPAAKQRGFLKQIGQWRGWIGADMVLLTTHYDMDLPVLAAAIDRFRTDFSSRAELKTLALP